MQLNKERIEGKTSKILEVVLEEKRRDIIKEWVDSEGLKPDKELSTITYIGGE